MQTRVLGNTGERLSAMGFGCMGLVGWYGTRNDTEARATLLQAIDRGINHLDTAAGYQNGGNERFVGSCIHGRRDEVFVATKYGISRMADGTFVADNRPEAIQASCEASLARLGVERIDLFYLHRIDRNVPIEESVGALAKLVDAGKIRYLGLSECSVATLRRGHAVHPIAAVQSEYSLWSRDPELEILPACRELGVGFVAYSPLGRGFLAGNFARLADLPADDNRRLQPRFQDANAEHNARITQAIGELAGRKGCSVAQLALAWVLTAGSDIHPIPGMKTRGHLADNLGALDVALSPAERSELARLVQGLGVHGERHPPSMMKILNG
jgi:aryl-alcohol dehydrogenase-like predicted oxidoreductase